MITWHLIIKQARTMGWRDILESVGFGALWGFIIWMMMNPIMVFGWLS